LATQPALQQLVQLPLEKYLLLESAVGEGIFFAGTKHAAIKVVASYTEDQLITSDPRQLLEIEAAKKEFEQEMFGGSEAEEEPSPIPKSEKPAQPQPPQAPEAEPPVMNI